MTSSAGVPVCVRTTKIRKEDPLGLATGGERAKRKNEIQKLTSPHRQVKGVKRGIGPGRTGRPCKLQAALG